MSDHYVPVGIPSENAGYTTGRSHAIVAFACAVVAIGFFPPVFGTAGIMFGLKAKRNGAPFLGVFSMIVAALFMTVGSVLGALSIANDIGGFIGIVGYIL